MKNWEIFFINEYFSIYYVYAKEWVLLGKPIVEKWVLWDKYFFYKYVLFRNEFPDFTVDFSVNYNNQYNANC